MSDQVKNTKIPTLYSKVSKNYSWSQDYYATRVMGSGKKFGSVVNF